MTHTIRPAAALAFVVFLGAALAQPRENRVPRAFDAEEAVERLDNILDLDETQEAQILEFHKAHAENIQNAREANDGPPPKDVHENLLDELDENVRSVLNEEQIPKYDKHVEFRKSRRDGDRPRRGMRDDRPRGNRNRW
ncbi:MAG: hypothetical protein GF419_05520 [Ignavibacteriales bacterium]|nr:hypothetical protein [Ignavibacteriales bacterium]